MKVIGLIPVRLESTRLPNKALLEIRGLPLIVHTMKRAQLAKSLTDVYVCTDSLDIAMIIKGHGGKVLMTGNHHVNGTERIAEAAMYLADMYLDGCIGQVDLIVDIQGDEPLINPDHIDMVVNQHLELLMINEAGPSSIVLPCLRIDTNQAATQNIVKVVSSGSKVVYLSRAQVPSPFRGGEKMFLKHLSIISFTPTALKKFASIVPQKDSLEMTEGIELLRAVTYGIPIHTVILDGDSFSVDVLEDYQRAVQQMSSDQTFEKYL